jgi:hypothetical protein
MINFFIVFVFGGDYNLKNEISGGVKLILNYYLTSHDNFFSI